MPGAPGSSGALAAKLACALLLAPAAIAETERAGQTTALPSFGQDPIFTGPAARYVVTVEAAGARCAVPADFDGDGDLDIVSVSSNDNTVAWYERLSDGSYGPKRMISRASNGARIVAVGDIDQDNRTDVIVASYYDHTVGWFRNLGGHFGSMSMISRTAIAAQGVSVADIDNDGDLDVLSASSGDSTVAWYENLGGGRFCEVKHVVDTNSIGVRTVVAADLDEDGFLDLAVASKDDNSIAWYRNDQRSNFQKIVIDSQARGAYSLVAVDVDQDGHLDLVTAANMDGFLPDNGEGGKVSLYLNGFGVGGGLGSFSKVAVTAGNSTGQNDFDWFVLSVWAGDLDMDGDVDIASASFSLLHQGGLSWYENADGAGRTWIRHQIYQTLGAKTGHYVFGADMDGDGDNDLLAVTNGDNKVQILTARTVCDDSLASPRAACCPREAFWNGYACVSCPSGAFLHRRGANSSCEPCPMACPRGGLSFQPAACHGVASCGDVAQSFARCDCGMNRYLETSTGVCAACPDGQITLGDRVRTPADFGMARRTFLDQTSYQISDLSWQGFHFSRCQVPSCDPGAYFNLTRGSCLPCLAGSFSIGGGVTHCTPCPEGSACAAGTAVPSPCQAGNYSSVGAEACSVSPAGSVTPIAGMGAPQACEPGTVSMLPGMVRCDACAVGRYADHAGQSSCTSCGAGHARPSLWTSMKPILRNGQIVWAYTDAASSPVANGTLGQGGCTCDVGARAAAGGECVPCGEGLDCQGGSAAYPPLLPLYWSSPDAPLDVFKCRNERVCPGGAPGACANERTHGRACGECDKGFYMSPGGCLQCTDLEMSRLIFPVLPLFAVPSAICVLYRFFRDLPAKWGSWNNMLSALLFLTLRYFQTVSLLMDSDVRLSAATAETVFYSGASLDVIALIDLDCAGFQGFLADFSIRNTLPLVVFGEGLLIYAVMQLVARLSKRHVGMDPDYLCNILFSFVYSFFMGVVSTSLTLFRCQPNPSLKKTLVKDPATICYEGNWTSALIVCIPAVLVYCVGSLLLFGYVVRIAPSRFMHVYFQKRWKFLFIKHRPDVHWWSFVVLFQGVVLNFGTILFSRPLDQLSWLTTCQVLYLGLLFFFMPWRSQAANVMDMVTQICSIMVFYVSSWTLQPEQMPADFDLRFFMAILAPIAVLPCVILYYVVPRMRLAKRGCESGITDELLSTVETVCRMFASLERQQQRVVLESIGEHDTRALRGAAKAIWAELEPRASRRLVLGTLRKSLVRASGSAEHILDDDDDDGDVHAFVQEVQARSSLRRSAALDVHAFAAATDQAAQLKSEDAFGTCSAVKLVI